LLIIFDGHLVLRMDRGAGSHKIYEWRGGDVGGQMPYSRGASPPNDVVAEVPTELLGIEKELLAEMIRECPTVTATLVHAMVDRARQFTSADLRDEKLVSLGKLAAGLAHELNNPASAVLRSAKILADSLSESESAARALATAHLSADQLAHIDAVRTMAQQRPERELDSVARADREDEIAQWLARYRVSERCAAPLTDSAITIDALNGLADTIHGESLDAALRWLAAGCLARGISDEIETASARIYDLVAAVKGFSYMDKAPTSGPVDVRVGIADTLTMLGSKTATKAVTVTVDLPNDLPPAHGVGPELNQVWMNLLDNALDAVAEGGHVTVAAEPSQDYLTVRIVDDGHGIPPDIQNRIFDPFFTTKGVGKGSGLGLDIVRRLLQRHDGEVAVQSEPGRTEFQVRLPVSKDAGAPVRAARFVMPPETGKFPALQRP
jgi:signal transduction histidine kinase